MILTKQAKVNAEKRRISQLITPHNICFKVIISHQIEQRYRFNSVHNRNGAQVAIPEKAKIFAALGKFLDDSTNLSITEVESKYQRQPDVRDSTYDPELDEEVEVQHFALFPSSDSKRDRVKDSVRIHGYFRSDYFIVTRLDWFHGYHN